MKIKKIGFIGLGNMGHHMALHIAKKGYEVFPYDININTLKNFKKNYLKKENDLLSSLANIDCVILIVPSSKEVFNIVFKELKNELTFQISFQLETPIIVENNTLFSNGYLTQNKQETLGGSIELFVAASITHAHNGFIALNQEKNTATFEVKIPK